MHVLFPPPPPPSACMAMHGTHIGEMKEKKKEYSKAFYFPPYLSYGSPLASPASVPLLRGPGLLWYQRGFLQGLTDAVRPVSWWSRRK